MNLKTTLPLPLALFALGSSAPLPVSAPALNQETARRQVQLVEEFRATGAEPVYWATYAKTDFARTPQASGMVDFAFSLLEFEAVLGEAEPVRFIVDSGAVPLVVSQNPRSQTVSFMDDAAIVKFVNRTAGTLEPRTGQWRQDVQAFDGTVVPGLAGGQLGVTCESEVGSANGMVYSLLRFESDPVAYEVTGSRVETTFRGMAVVDPDREFAYHMFFQQRGKVTHGDLVSEIDQLTTMSLLDGSGRAVLDPAALPSGLVGDFLFRTRPDYENLAPGVFQQETRPVWAAPVWLAGRLAETSLGMVAEQGTNPLPVTSIASLLLSDQILGYAGNILYDLRRMAMAELEEEEIDPSDGNYSSPLRRYYSEYAPGSTYVNPRFILLGAATKGAVKVGDVAFWVVGMPENVSKQVFSGSPASHLGFAKGAGDSTPAVAMIPGPDGVAPAAARSGSSASSGDGLSGTQWALIGGGGIVLIGGVAALAGGGGGGDDPPPAVQSAVVTVSETFDQGSGCFSGTITLQLTGGNPGDTWLLGFNGFYDSICNGGQQVLITGEQGTVAGNGTLTLQIPLSPFFPCLDGAISLNRNSGPPGAWRIDHVVPAAGINDTYTPSGDSFSHPQGCW